MDLLQPTIHYLPLIPFRGVGLGSLEPAANGIQGGVHSASHDHIYSQTTVLIRMSMILHSGIELENNMLTWGNQKTGGTREPVFC